jgi:hypothetical protein
MTLKELLQNKLAKFCCYKNRTLWYRIDDFQFPIPILELGDQSVNDEVPLYWCQRWIKRHLDVNTKWSRKNTERQMTEELIKAGWC